MFLASAACAAWDEMLHAVYCIQRAQNMPSPFVRIWVFVCWTLVFCNQIINPDLDQNIIQLLACVEMKLRGQINCRARHISQHDDCVGVVFKHNAHNKSVHHLRHLFVFKIQWIK